MIDIKQDGTIMCWPNISIPVLHLAKVKPDAIIPTKRDEDAGYDVYPCFDEDYIVVPPHETVMIPTGIASAFSSDFVIVLKERGSTGTKGIAQRSGVIDSNFRGEWMCPITNTNDDNLFITDYSIEELIEKHSGGVDDEGWSYIIKDEKRIWLDYGEDEREDGNPILYPKSKAICQALVLPVPRMECAEILYDDLLKIESNRGTGMLGSSGK